MASGKIIGGPFSEEVIDQLAVRSKIVSKGSRTNEDLMYMNSKTGWVKFTSGVNVGGSSALAKKYVLIGGVKGRTGENTYSNFTGDDGKGFRPMPGITAVTVNSVGQFGQLKQATVTFNCWDRSQITELELLFMRPGFTALLEWGHSIYAKSVIDYEKTPQTITSFFTAGTTKEKLYQQVQELRKNSKGNYEGIFGFIKNFSWKYRQDGGYDCTTTVISIGEIIESLTVDIDTPAVTTTTAATGDASKTVPATMLQDILTTLKESDVASAWANIVAKFPTFADKHTTVGGRAGVDIADLPLSSLKVAGSAESEPSPKFTYISLRSFCEIVNSILVIDNNKKNLIKLNTDIRPLDSEGGDSSSIPACRFRTYKFHTSSDPGVCMLITEGSKNWPYNETLLTALQSGKTGSTDEILNIYVNIGLLENAMTSLLAKKKEERTLLNLFAPILTEINKTLGGINEIGLQYEEDEFKYYIVDRKVQVDTKEVSLLNITGLKSTVSRFDFTTKLSPAITTMCAISAQAGAADVGLEAEALLRWNEGLQDRIITKKSIKTDEPDTPASGSATPEEQRATQQKARRDTIQAALSQVWNSKQYDSEAIAVAKTQFGQFSTNYVQYYAAPTTTGNAGPAGIIPFQVGIEMDGISGIKIGQAFRINSGIMPSKYDGVVGFIVTGIDHSIAANRWVTNLKAQTIILEGTVKKGTGPAYSDDFKETGESNNEEKGLKPKRVKSATSAKKIASFGKVSDSVPQYGKPLLDTIAYTEGTAAVGSNGYDVLVGFGQIEGWTENYDKGHPKKVIKLNKTLSSSAAGRYQFLTDTWKGLKLGNFNKSNQDLGGWNLVRAQKSAQSSFTVAKAQIKDGKIDAYANKGFLTFLDKNYACWASLVNRNGVAKYGGQKGPLGPEGIYDVYIEAVKKYS